MVSIAEIYNCPDCGGHRIEKVLVETVVTVEVTEIDCNGQMEFGYPEVETDKPDQYRCADCDYPVGGGNFDACEVLTGRARIAERLEAADRDDSPNREG